MQAVRTSWLLSKVEPASDCNNVTASPASFVVTIAGPKNMHKKRKVVLLSSLDLFKLH